MTSAPAVGVQAPRRSLLVRVLLAAITGYKLVISPTRLPSCRYTPSCSSYALEAIDEHGAGRGSWLALRRLLRCHPFHRGGYDPVPARDERAA